LAASTALGLILVLASQGSHAQQAPEPLSEQINSAVPMPDTDQLPPPTAKDIGVAEPLNVEPTA